MNCWRNSRPALSRLILHRNKPSLPPIHQYNRLIHAAEQRPRPPETSVYSVRGLFVRHVYAYYRPSLPMHLRSFTSRNLPPVEVARRWYRSTRQVALELLLLCAVGFLNSCATVIPIFLHAFCHREIVPYTNRVHWIMDSPPNEREFDNLLFTNRKEKLGDKVLGESDSHTIRVRLVAADIIRAIPTKSTSNVDGGRSSPRAESMGRQAQPQAGHLPDLDWEVIVIRDDRVHAYCHRNGKIVVCTGLLDYFKTDAEIATVIGHEVGHVIARHCKEFNIQILASTPTLLKLLPFSRRNEMEADLVGMMLMAAAGYDPRVAPRGKAMKEALELYEEQVRQG
ncbi:hypothetical protein ACQ4PT_057973 [Festuca glaucescens]